MINEPTMLKLYVRQGPPGPDSQNALRVFNMEHFEGGHLDRLLWLMAQSLDQYLLNDFGQVLPDREWRILR